MLPDVNRVLDDPPWVVIVITPLLALLIYCFQPTIDALVDKHLLNRSKDLEGALRAHQLEITNGEGRKMWVPIVWATVVARRETFDMLITAYGFLVVPLALITQSGATHSRYGWADQTVQQLFLATRLLLPDSELVRTDYQSSLIFAVMMFTWYEFSLNSFAMLILNHLVTNALMLGLGGDATTCLMISFVMIVMHCYRRGMNFARTGPLAWFVPEFCGDVSQDTVGMIRQFLYCNPHTREMLLEEGRADGISTAPALGKGTGQGLFSQHPQDPDFSVEELSASFAGREDDLNSLAGSVDEQIASLREEDLSALGALLDQDPDRAESSFGSLCDRFGGSSEDEMTESKAASSGEQSRKRSRNPSASTVPSMPSAHELLNSMSYDPMAQLDPTTGAVLWSNAAFTELTTSVGSGNAVFGLQRLMQTFLVQVPLELVKLNSSIGVGPFSMNLCSSTQRCTCRNYQELILWTLHQPPAWQEPSVQQVALPYTVPGGPTNSGHKYMRSKAHEARGEEHDYQCGYCGTVRTSASGCSDGHMRIRCGCGGRHKDGKHRLHSKWEKVAPSNAGQMGHVMHQWESSQMLFPVSV